jgi:hypothetical protein
VHRVDEAGVEKLPDGGGPAAEPNVLARRCVPRPGQDRGRIGVDEVERGVAQCERSGQVITGDLRSKVLVALACSELYRLSQEIDFI